MFGDIPLPYRGFQNTSRALWVWSGVLRCCKQSTRWKCFLSFWWHHLLCFNNISSRISLSKLLLAFVVDSPPFQTNDSHFWWSPKKVSMALVCLFLWYVCCGVHPFLFSQSFFLSKIFYFISFSVSCLMHVGVEGFWVVVLLFGFLLTSFSLKHISICLSFVFRTLLESGDLLWICVVVLQVKKDKVKEQDTVLW